MGGHTVLVHYTSTGVFRFFTVESRVASEARQAMTFRLVVNYTARCILSTWIVVRTWVFTFFIDASLKVSAVRILDTFNYLTMVLRIPCGAWRTLTLCCVGTAHTHSTWWAHIILKARIKALVVLAHFSIRTTCVIFTVNC